MKEPISIKEIFAVMLRRGKLIVCATLILAIAAGAVQTVKNFQAAHRPEYAAEAIEARYQQAVEEYERARSEAETQIAGLRIALQRQQAYIDNAPLMKIDPYNKYSSQIVVVITGVEEPAIPRESGEEEAAAGGIISEIQSLYETCWNNLSLAAELKGHPYEGVHESYLREVVSISISQAGAVSVNASAQTPEGAEQLVQAAYDCFVGLHPAVEQFTCQHELTVVAGSTKSVIDPVHEELQITHLTKLAELQMAVSEAEEALAAIPVPVKENPPRAIDIKNTVVMAVVGAVAGGLLACVWVLLAYIMEDKIETSAQCAGVLNAPYFGSTAGKGSVWNRLACRFMNEPVWKDEESALRYVTANVKKHAQSSEKIAVLTTLGVPENDANIQRLIRAVRAAGLQVQFANMPETNPEAVLALCDCGSVILAERLGVSGRGHLLRAVTIMEQMDAKLLGFVMI